MYSSEKKLILPYIVYKHTMGEFRSLNESVFRLKMIYSSKIKVCDKVAKKVAKKLAVQLIYEFIKIHKSVLADKDIEKVFSKFHKELNHIEIFAKRDYDKKNLVSLLKEPKIYFIHKGERVAINIRVLIFYDYPRILVGVGKVPFGSRSRDKIEDYFTIHSDYPKRGKILSPRNDVGILQQEPLKKHLED